MTPEAFEQKVEECLTVLPERVRSKIDNVALIIENEPSAEERRAQQLGAHETLLGLYKGVPLNRRGTGYGIGMTMPDTITLFRNPIVEAVRERNVSIEKVISETILHEFAHYLGMNEEEVRTWEAARYQRE
jgi:predicted Zn-dependent protease with MMP-like domain